MSDLRLIEAAKAGKSADVQALIQSDVDINEQDEHGWTPLCWAAGSGNVEIVKLLVENGAAPLQVGRDRRTPYQIALAAAHIEAAQLLRAEEEKAGHQRPERPYCKAYVLKELRRFPAWADSAHNGLTDDDTVFLHQDFTVTRSVWHDEDVIFSQVTPEWRTFCADVLKFKAPDDVDLVAPGGS